MIVLIDTNVIIDFLLTRQPFYTAAAEIIGRCASRDINGYIAFHSIANLWYILRKIPDEMRRSMLTDICSILQIVSISHSEVVKAIGMKDFVDFEDCLQAGCAASVGAKYIITRNIADFIHSQIPAVLPEDFVSLT